MYKIGEFSMLNQVTIKTLRYYDEIGLFKPKQVDNYSGYRYYDDEQIEEFNMIMKYKSYGFSLEEIKEMMETKNDDIIKEKIKAIKDENQNNIVKIEELKSMLGETMLDIEYIEYEGNFKIGKRITLKDRSEIELELSKIYKELIDLEIKVKSPILCNLELGYENENIDVFLGYEVKEFEVPPQIRNKYPYEKGELEFIMKTREEKFIITKCRKDQVNVAYSEIIKYAHDNNLQITEFFVERYSDRYIELLVPARDLKETNPDYLKHLNSYNSKEISRTVDKKLVGTWEIREILPFSKYMFNPSKQKSSLDTKYKTLILNSNGTTNYDNLIWNERDLILIEKGIYIPFRITRNIKLDGQEYIEILIDEYEDKRNNGLPLEYIYVRKQ